MIAVAFMHDVIRHHYAVGTSAGYGITVSGAGVTPVRITFVQQSLLGPKVFIRQLV
jgi:hypothetical protein